MEEGCLRVGGAIVQVSNSTPNANHNLEDTRTWPPLTEPRCNLVVCLVAGTGFLGGTRKTRREEGVFGTGGDHTKVSKYKSLICGILVKSDGVSASLHVNSKEVQEGTELASKERHDLVRGSTPTSGHE